MEVEVGVDMSDEEDDTNFRGSSEDENEMLEPRRFFKAGTLENPREIKRVVYDIDPIKLSSELIVAQLRDTADIVRQFKAAPCSVQELQNQQKDVVAKMSANPELYADLLMQPLADTRLGGRLSKMVEGLIPDFFASRLRNKDALAASPFALLDHLSCDISYLHSELDMDWLDPLRLVIDWVPMTDTPNLACTCHAMRDAVWGHWCYCSPSLWGRFPITRFSPDSTDNYRKLEMTRDLPLGWEARLSRTTKDEYYRNSLDSTELSSFSVQRYYRCRLLL